MLRARRRLTTRASLMLGGLVLASFAGTGPMTSVAVSATCAPRLAASPQWLSEGPANPTDVALNVPSRGTVRAAALFVDFPDAPGTTDPETITSTWLAGGAAWLRTSSYGRLNVTLDPHRQWLRMPRASSTYGFPAVSYDLHRVYIADALALADPVVDFSQTDFVYIVAPPAAAIPQSPTFRGLLGEFVRDGRDIGRVVTFGRDGHTVGRFTVAHETGHLLGLPDLYAHAATGQHRYVGSWDLMGNIFDPTDYLAWHRLKLGWLDASQFTCARGTGVTTAMLTPLNRAGGRKAIFVRTGPYTALVAENRQRTGNDRRICDTGLLVYRVDSRIATGKGPIQVLGGRTGGCGFGDRSDAPLAVGQRLVVGRTTFAVTAASRSTLAVRVTRR